MWLWGGRGGFPHTDNAVYQALRTGQWYNQFAMYTNYYTAGRIKWQMRGGPSTNSWRSSPPLDFSRAFYLMASHIPPENTWVNWATPFMDCLGQFWGLRWQRMGCWG